MTQAALGQAGASAVTVNQSQAALGQGGALAVTANQSLGTLAQAGASAVTVNLSQAVLGQAGTLALVRYRPAYAVAQAGVLGITRNQADVAVAQAGVLALSLNRAAMGVAQAGVLALVTYVQPPLEAPLQAPARRPGTAIDIQLAYNATLRVCDVVFDAPDFSLDETPASVLLFSVLANRRAKQDDVLPFPVPDWADPNTFNARRGSALDALDPAGALAGSRLWLVERALADEATRQAVENYLAEAVGPLEQARGYALQIVVRYLSGTILGYGVRAGATNIEFKKALN